MTHTLTKNGKTVAIVTAHRDGVVARLYGRCEGMVSRFKTLDQAKSWAESELS